MFLCDGHFVLAKWVMISRSISLCFYVNSFYLYEFLFSLFLSNLLSIMFTALSKVTLLQQHCIDQVSLQIKVSCTTVLFWKY